MSGGAYNRRAYNRRAYNRRAYNRRAYNRRAYKQQYFTYGGNHRVFRKLAYHESPKNIAIPD